ncbi:MAG: GIY-YIG nuclease family protein [Gemmatimonadaceae bacterium]
MPGIPTVYILASKPRGTLYTGVTSQLVQRIWQRREGCADGFTKRYGVKRLVWYEQHTDMINALKCEKTIKRWPRQWKFNIIQKFNPEWEDLWAGIVAR